MRPVSPKALLILWLVAQSVTRHNPAFSFCMFSQTHVKCNPRRPWPRHADTGNPRAQPLLNQNRQRLAGRPTLCMTPPPPSGRKELLELLK